jgi:alkylation response protein AidB-like acyl-CoA dehydrogenase
MSDKYFSRRNIDFTLFEALNITELSQFPYFNAHDKDTLSMVMDASADIAENLMRPHFADADRHQPELVDGQVKVHHGLHEYIKTYSESGFMSAPFSNEWGGMQLPKTVAAAVEFIMGSANNSFIMYCDLAKGAANLIYTYGSEEQKAYYLPKMFAGEWLGTMCLTETQAGSSLSDVACTAVPQADGTYKISGQKIFISAGDHDVTDNIVHLVLARIEGAPKGTKGISLFIVPKNRQNVLANDSAATEGGALESNDVTSVGVYHKMGQKATPAMHLEFGAKGDCIGYLIGEANRGLPHMFLMMNGARLGVGMGGIHIASAAYYSSLQYARERPQGRRLNEKTALGEPITIIHHPDVRRMLMYQKAIMEGGFSLILQCYKYLDLEKANAHDVNVKKQYNDLLELLTPVAKTFGSEMGYLAVNQGLQVFGGYGYTEDFELEQLVRDCRIMSLYEGTTGIQAQALLGRQIVGNKGHSLTAWYNEVNKDVQEAENIKTLKPYWKKQMAAMKQLQKVTSHLFKVAEKGDTEILLSDANLYIEYFSILNVSWQWLKQGIVAHKALANGQDLGDDKVFYASKIQTMQFYFHYEIPKLKGLAERLMDKTVLTIFDEKQEILI